MPRQMKKEEQHVRRSYYVVYKMKLNVDKIQFLSFLLFRYKTIICITR